MTSAPDRIPQQTCDGLLPIATARICGSNQNFSIAGHFVCMDMSHSKLSDLDRLHIERSRFLDAFVALEREIVRLLVASNTKYGSECLGQKIDLMRKAKAAPQYSKARMSKVSKVLDQIEALLPVRNDIVHGALSIVTIEGQVWACFFNASQGSSLAPEVRMTHLENLRKLSHQVRGIAKDLAIP